MRSSGCGAPCAVRDASALRLCEVGRFPGVVYLGPEPRSEVDELVARLAAAFPETPPYGGAFGPAPVPHLTVATSADEGVLDEIERRLRDVAADSLRVVVDRVSISEQGRGPGGRWAVRVEVPFGQSSIVARRRPPTQAPT